MAGFLERASKEEEVNPDSALEETYEKLFPKIARDFVYRGDYARDQQQVRILIDPIGLSPINFNSNVEARLKALEYKSVLDSGRDGSQIYEDLIDLSE